MTYLRAAHAGTANIILELRVGDMTVDFFL